ncbi:hypothetical protein HanRHA438_Chr13g0582751 [Helianthus annuus]|nr:hypothetical protein HanRHA438_Chr13g0582751 [Helianthus annuus]
MSNHKRHVGIPPKYFNLRIVKLILHISSFLVKKSFINTDSLFHEYLDKNSILELDHIVQVINK